MFSKLDRKLNRLGKFTSFSFHLLTSLIKTVVFTTYTAFMIQKSPQKIDDKEHWHYLNTVGQKGKDKLDGALLQLFDYTNGKIDASESDN